jgi:uncharacterized protein YcbK (DUF882 family)
MSTLTPNPAPSPGRPAILSRRRALIGCAAALALAPPCRPAMASLDHVVRRGYGNPLLDHTKAIRVHNGNTDESMAIPYVVNGTYYDRGLEWLRYLLRDHHDGSMHQMDLRLWDVLYVVQTHFLSNNDFITVTSGYRSRATNERLAEVIPGVARNSFHIRGQAIDFQIAGRRITDIADYLRRWNFGGVGTYDAHVHIDTGRPRTW